MLRTLSAILLSAVALTLPASKAQVLAWQIPLPAPTEGGSCKVTSGVNAGKTGTYDSDLDCCGSWGCTECGTSKCTSALKRKSIPEGKLSIPEKAITE